MYVIFLKFAENKAQIQDHLEAHKSWLAEGFDAGVFLAAGSLEAGQGGAILTRREDRAALEARVADDPFVVAGVVTAEITGFEPTRTDARLAFLKEAA
ncbi:YciI family protein [Phaeobacter sp. HF9A]|uniref:YciI family protein n=1 Tax=Phaeobacter sp. HF9A TaxID=2721561 RepID=UPI00142FC8EC|nr:YciI family protein [Phaeobacter sp. HF9A]NIZ15761.1 hypothetical protein [Phaeobacter sp. HF9A]